MGITDMTTPNIHTSKHTKEAVLKVRRLNLKGKTIRRSLSIVIMVSISTDTSLDSMERTPTIWQPIPDLQLMSCLKYTPRHLTSIIAIVKRYTPINRSATAKFVSKKDWTLFSSLSMIRHIMTRRLPRKARIPRIQMQIWRVLFFMRSSQLENSSTGASHSTPAIDFLA